ncbi:NAD(P)-dependent oxidoreductase [bacterium DOLZORAL124_64_63]|nr:MAG: NAD(P)-dependent oxidoreductase [bacterium DOLZORAL124_64_63]
MLKNKVTLITGASAGIGEACARTFAREGSRLILAARRKEKLEKLAATLADAYGTRALTIELDVRDRQQVNEAIAGLPADWREIDILINNAGLSRGLDRIQDGYHLDWEEMIDTNIKGLLWVSRAVMPGMVARDRGHIINLGSIAGRQVYPGGNVYCATKHAVRALNQALRIDLLGTRVRCSSVDPGMVETEFSEVRFRGDTERAAAVYRDFLPLKAEDIAETILFCATRPPHVNIQEVLIMPQDQAAAQAIHRRGVPDI